MTLIPRRNLDDLAREFGLGKYKGTKPKPDQKPDNSSTCSIEDLADRYRLHNVEYNGGIYTVDWSKDLTDSGNSHTQDEWIQLLQHQEFQLPSGPLYHATLRTLHSQRAGAQSGLVKKIAKVFRKDFQDYLMMTSTRIRYNPASPDTVMHDYKSDKEQSVNADLVGPDGFITNNPFEDALDALVGARDVLEIGKVNRWISGKRSYLWRMNSRPDQTTERALVFGINYSDWFYIFGANVVISLQRSSRGVVVRPVEAAQPPR